MTIALVKPVKFHHVLIKFNRRYKNAEVASLFKTMLLYDDMKYRNISIILVTHAL